MRISGLWLSVAIVLLVLEVSGRYHGHRRKYNGRRHDDWRPSWMRDATEEDASGMPKWQQKLCRKMRKWDLKGIIPGFEDCPSEGSEVGSRRRTWSSDSRRRDDNLERKLREERETSQRLLQQKEREKSELQRKTQSLEQQLRNEKNHANAAAHARKEAEADKRRAVQSSDQMRREKEGIQFKLQSKERELTKGFKSNERLKEQVQEQQRKILDLERRETAGCQLPHVADSKHYKRRLEAKISELESARADKKAKDAQILELQAQIEEKDRKLEELPRKSDQISLLESAKGKLEHQLNIQRARAESHCTPDSPHRPPPGGSDDDDDDDDDEEDHSFSMLNYTVFALIALAIGLLKCRKELRRKREQLNGMALQMQAKTSEIETLRAEVSGLSSSNADLNTKLNAKVTDLCSAQAELRDELGDMMRMDQLSQKLGQDFAYHIFDERGDEDQVTIRSIKVQCPGVRHSDVEIEIIWNGCIVTVNRHAEQGVEEVQNWVRRFQFRPSEGLFEFKEDQMTLERGFLILVFRAYSFQKRSVRFPKHFDLSETDVDGDYDYPGEVAPSCSSVAVATTPFRAAPVRALSEPVPAGHLTTASIEGEDKAETSPSMTQALDTVDYEAKRAEIESDAQAAAHKESGSRQQEPDALAVDAQGHAQASQENSSENSFCKVSRAESSAPKGAQINDQIRPNGVNDVNMSHHEDEIALQMALAESMEPEDKEAVLDDTSDGFEKIQEADVSVSDMAEARDA